LRRVIAQAVAGTPTDHLNAPDTAPAAEPDDPADDASGESRQTGTQHFHS